MADQVEDMGTCGGGSGTPFSCLDLALCTTDDLAEGSSNLYFSNERAQDAVGSILTDSSSVDFTYNDGAGTITAVVLAAGVDHGGLGGLSDDDHTQYALLAGRSGGQTIIGGTGTTDDLVLRSTSGVASDYASDIVFQGGNNGNVELLRMMEGFATPLWRVNKDFFWQVQNLTSTGFGTMMSYMGGSLQFNAESNVRFTLLESNRLFCDVGGISVGGNILLSATADVANPAIEFNTASFNQILCTNDFYITVTGGSGDIILRTGSASELGRFTAGGNLQLGGRATASELHFLEPSGSGSNYTAFKAQAQSGNITYTLPPDDGDAGEQLTTDGSGSLTWEPPGGPAASKQFVLMMMEL